MPRLSIVIVSYNSVREIDACLASLSERPPRTDHGIVMVDNASGDGTADHVRRRWPAVRVIEAGGNLGFARANNLGIRDTAGELVLLLNPDTVAKPGAIDTLVDALEGTPDAAVIGPRVVDGQGRAELSFGPMLTPLAELRQKMLVRRHDRADSMASSWVERATRRRRHVDWVSGVCLLIRRADLVAAGLLDERYFMYFEDVELCAAVRAANRRVLFEPRAEIVHLRGRSASSAQGTRAIYDRSHLAFYEKHHPRLVRLLRWYLRVLRKS